MYDKINSMFTDTQEACTPLMWCSQEGFVAAAKLLLERGADVTKKLLPV